jgi:hypothetical protein
VISLNGVELELHRGTPIGILERCADRRGH